LCDTPPQERALPKLPRLVEFSMITALTTFIEQPVRRKRELAFFRFPKK
jgi:hypothetical protein